MAARNRPRALPRDDADAHEERDLWSKIVNDLKDRTRQAKRISEIADEIAALEAKYDGDDSGEFRRLSFHASRAARSLTEC
jgi:SAGA-associated factor 29